MCYDWLILWKSVSRLSQSAPSVSSLSDLSRSAPSVSPLSELHQSSPSVVSVSQLRQWAPSVIVSSLSQLRQSARPNFFIVKTVVITLQQLFLFGFDKISTHVISSVTSLTTLWWGVWHCRTCIDWPGLAVYHVHPLCIWPKATDLFFNCSSFSGEVNKVISFGNAKKSATQWLSVSVFTFTVFVFTQRAAWSWSHLYCGLDSDRLQGVNSELLKFFHWNCLFIALYKPTIACLLTFLQQSRMHHTQRAGGGWGVRAGGRQ